MIFDYIIIGSGPSSTGFLSSKKLIGKKVCVVDAGVEYKNFYKKHPNNHELYNLHDLKNKSYFGQNEATKFKSDLDNADYLNIRNSYMLGGLTNVWGAASIEYDRKALDSMGIYHDLSSEFEYINKLIHNREIKLTSDLNSFDIYKKLSKKPSSSKVYPSRLAINAQTCINCGSCFYGCAYNSIYNSKTDYKKFISNYIYYTGYLAHKIFNKNHYYELLIIDLKTNKKKILKSKKIIIGCGAINSSKLLLRSFADINYINLADSQCFYLPLISLDFKKIFRAPQIEPIELSNFFIQSLVEGENIHGQFYSFGPFLKNQIKKTLHLNTSIFDSLFNIAHIYQGFLPSKYSAAGQFRPTAQGRIEFSKILDPDLNYLNKVASNLSNFFKTANLISINTAKKIEPIFSAYHFGAMKIYKNDRLYEPNSFDGTIPTLKNIHVIDSSILKSLPSGPFTSLVMANARFIADRII
jgi:hypothetical protein